MNKVAAVAWGLAHWSGDLNVTGSVPLREIRAELRKHSLFIKFDAGLRPGQSPKVQGFWLYYNKKGRRNICFGTLPKCCRAALCHIGIARKEDT